MKTGILFRKWTAALVAVLLMISLFALPAFADEATTEAAGEATTEATGEATTEATGDSTDEATDEAETKEDSSAGSNENSDKEDEGINTGLVIGLIIGAVVLAIAVVLCIKFREKIGKFLRVYKSEAKKIVWLPWNQTKKSTLVVLVVLILCAVAICLIDLALSRSFLKFVELFSK